MKKSNLFLEGMVVVFGPLGILVSNVFGYEVTVTVTKTEEKKEIETKN